MLPWPKSSGCGGRGGGGGDTDRQRQKQTQDRELQFIECYTLSSKSLFRENFSSDNARMKDGLQFLSIHMEGSGEKQVYKNHNF